MSLTLPDARPPQPGAWPEFWESRPALRGCARWPGGEGQRRKRGSAAGRSPASGIDRYKDRNTAGRCFNKLKTHRAVATRHGKRERIYLGTIDVACIRIWLRDPAI
jgi:transposase